jgi:hypothetical protein
MANRENSFRLPLTAAHSLNLRAEDMNSTHASRMRIVLSSCLLAAVVALIAPEARGQDYHLPMISAPPPMKFVSRNERTQLSAARDAKARTRATIELAEARLSRAELLTAGQQYDAASSELGMYQGLVDDALTYLDKSESKKKLRDTYKRLEISLRGHSARIEAIRRVTPNEYAVHVKAICECARNARALALNGFFGDTVIRNDSPEDEKHSGGGDVKAAASGTVNKQ